YSSAASYVYKRQDKKRASRTPKFKRGGDAQKPAEAGGESVADDPETDAPDGLDDEFSIEEDA
ncbi:MAG: hypothetical protein K2K99_07380, partial [Muribaculaceae bacterium]|nr:hypothetical protein [Muribaculaceae bacterium]